MITKEKLVTVDTQQEDVTEEEYIESTGGDTTGLGIDD